METYSDEINEIGTILSEYVDEINLVDMIIEEKRLCELSQLHSNLRELISMNAMIHIFEEDAPFCNKSLEYNMRPGFIDRLFIRYEILLIETVEWYNKYCKNYYSIWLFQNKHNPDRQSRKWYSQDFINAEALKQRVNLWSCLKGGFSIIVDDVEWV